MIRDFKQNCLNEGVQICIDYKWKRSVEARQGFDPGDQKDDAKSNYHVTVEKHTLCLQSHHIC